MFENEQKMAIDRQKAAAVLQSHQAKQNDMVSRASERQMAAQQKAAQQKGPF